MDLSSWTEKRKNEVQTIILKGGGKLNFIVLGAVGEDVKSKFYSISIYRF